MSAALDLARLQEVDTRIAALSADVAAAESLVLRDPDLERARDAAAAAERERQSLEVDAAAGEAEVNALQARITTLDRKLYGGSVHNPQDLLDMQRELDVLRSRRSEAEDRALAQLDRAEGAAAVERAGLESLRDAEARRASQVAPL
ncbi:MAG: hypothetical protein JOZ75_14225, partial [Candidatus Dormibacteraeota bacterium]|nr:hypothetical protein [Candidatus Dormibacteraeota bacterium]